MNCKTSQAAHKPTKTWPEWWSFPELVDAFLVPAGWLWRRMVSEWGCMSGCLDPNCLKGDERRAWAQVQRTTKCNRNHVFPENHISLWIWHSFWGRRYQGRKVSSSLKAPDTLLLSCGVNYLSLIDDLLQVFPQIHLGILMVLAGQQLNNLKTSLELRYADFGARYT